MKHRYSEEDLTIDFWPSINDIVTSVLLLLLFLVTIFIVTQAGLAQMLGTKETALARLSKQLEQLTSQLKISETRSTLLRGEVEGALNLLEQTQAGFSSEIERTQTDLADTRGSLNKTSEELSAAMARIQATQREGAQKEQKLQASSQQIEELSKRVSEYLEQVKLLNTQLTNTKQELNTRQVSLGDLNKAVEALNKKIAELSSQLEATKTEAASRKLELTQLVGELEKRDKEISRLRRFEQYRSEFFARLASVFEGQPDIKVVGDRFVFQGEVLFDSGKADLREDGKQLLSRFVTIYKDLELKIPPDIGFNIQIQGHTDTDPIVYAQKFTSNWDLSTARATEVVRYLISRGIPATRMSAAGFSEHYPATPGSSPEAKRQNRRIEIFFTQR
jgi:chemotaxis protein MotB